MITVYSLFLYAGHIVAEMGREVGPKNSTDRDQRSNSSTVVLSKTGIQAYRRQTRGEQAKGSGTEGCSGYQGRNHEGGSGTSRVEAKEAIREIVLESFTCC